MDMNFTYHYPSQRAPVMASNIVTTSHPLAAQAGLSMLAAGGTAADAAVATAMALTVLEPTSNGIGADNFALVWAGGGLHGLNASGRAPAGLDRAAYASSGEISTLGWPGVTCPGAVSGWIALASEFGRLPLATLAAPAIRYAREGYLVSPEIGYYWKRAADIFARHARQHEALLAPWFATFAPGGKAPATGTKTTLPDHAATLEAIADSGGAAFYRGALAEKIDAAARAGGSALRMADLASHQADWVRPISLHYNGYKLHEIPPNGQGIAALIALGIMRLFDLAAEPRDSVATIHLSVEAMKLAFADAHQFVADPDFMTVRPEALLDEAYLGQRAALIDPNRAQDFGHGTPATGGTVLLAAADAEGMMVSFIQSNYTGFGSGIVVPETGIALHNRGCNFSLTPGHVNEIGPRKRPYHTIIPGFVTRTRPDGSDEPVMAMGVMGGFMQPQGHMQVLMRMADHGMNPQTALDGPRWQVEKGLRVSIEPGFDPSIYEGLAALGHDVVRHDARNAAFGRGQAIVKVDGGYIAGCDPRCDGQAVGF
jgi:gamma-glutamyltranspeptidase/glutathione hydrolase